MSKLFPFMTLLTIVSTTADSEEMRTINIDREMLPEFCMALFQVTGNAAEAAMWRARWQFDEPVISMFVYTIKGMREQGTMNTFDILAATDACKDVRKENEHD